jgi:hypothetical protein
MKIDIAKEDLWWLREALTHAIRHMESQPNPAAFSKMPHVARKTYKKLSVAMKSWDHDKSYFPNVTAMASADTQTPTTPTNGQ